MSLPPPPSPASAFRFVLNGAPVRVDALPPTTTLLDWLRARGLTGTKEGCAEGDCGACTVALLDPEAPGGPTWRAVCSCLVLLPQLADREVLTVEGLASGEALHPAQRAMVEAMGSQCGYCTPGFVMSIFEACHRKDLDEDWQIDDQLCGNLCRCTGYRPIREALERVAGTQPDDGLSPGPRPPPADLSLAFGEQRFLRPTTWEALLPALRAARDEGEPLRVVAGATDLGLEVTRRQATWPVLLDLGALEGMRERLPLPEGGWRLGAGTLLADLEDLARGRWPALEAALRYFGSRQIKNRGTLGGNLCNASPIGDLAPALIAMRAEVALRGPEGERRLPLDRFFTGYRRTALDPGELLVAVELPPERPDELVGAYKVSKRRELDISAVFGAFNLRLDEGRVARARLAYGGMAATPARALRAEAALIGRPWTPEAVEGALPALAEDFTPLSDHRGGAAYRQAVAANLLRRFVVEHPGLPA